MKINPIKIALLTLSAGVLLEGNSYAGNPSIFRSPPKHLKNSKGYPVIGALDDLDSSKTSQNTVYYYPSTSRKLEISATNYSSTVLNAQGRRGHLCEAIDGEMRIVNKLVERQEEFEELKAKEFKKMSKARAKAGILVANACGPVEQIEDNLKSTEESLNVLRERITEESLIMNRCLQSGKDSEICEKNYKALIKQQESLFDLKLDQRDELAQKMPPCRKARRKMAELDQTWKEIDEVLLSMIQMKTAQLESMQAYGKINGGTLSTTWDDGFQQAKQDIEAENHGGIKVLPLQKNLLNIYVGGYSLAGDLPTTLEIRYSGMNSSVRPKGFTHSPTILDKNSGVDPKNGTNAINEQGDRYFSLLNTTPFHVDTHSFGGNAGAIDITLSAFGACGTLAQVENNSGKTGITTSISYVFGNSSQVRVKASYNMWKIYEKITRGGSRRTGFLKLSRENYTHVWENMREGDDFRFEFYAEDAIESSRQSFYRQMLKQELAARIANTFGGMTRDAQLPEIPTNPVESLKGVFYFHGFFGKVAFAGVREIFGNNSAVSNIHSRWNKTVSEKWDYNRITPMVVSHSVELMHPPMSELE